MTTLNIGVVGYSGTPFDEKEAKRLLVKGLDAILADNPGVTSVNLISGLTDLGIPAIAYRIAKQRGWRTVGVACAKAVKYACFAVDESHTIGANWGDESEEFLKRCDVILRVGGGTQSLDEVARFKKKGSKNKTYEYELARLDK